MRPKPGTPSRLRSVTAAVVGVVLNLALVFGAAVLFPVGAGGADWLAASIAVVAFLGLWRLRIDVLWVVVGGGVLGVLHGLM